MAELKLIHGRQSIKYDRFRDYEFRSCRAIATRLMGVTALKVAWRGRENKRAGFFQIIHLDYSEYGIDEYREFECLPGAPDCSEKKAEMSELWDHFIRVMGGEIRDIEPQVMMRLIADALPFAAEDVDREYDSDENREFRSYALLRLGFMKKALDAAGISEDDCSTADAIKALIPQRLGAYETINYFIMRLIDHDYAAASVLTALSEDFLKETALAKPGIQTLMRSNIIRGERKDYPSSRKGSYPFCCRITTLGRQHYHHSTFVIWLNGSLLSGNPLITDIKVGTVMDLSDYEAAMQLGRPEYITAFECSDSVIDNFNPSYITPLRSAEMSAVPNGAMYTIYKEDNSHVNRAEYRLEDDVTGYALLTIGGELILMSHNYRDITVLDEAAAFSMYGPSIRIKGRYMLDSSLFQVMCATPGARLDDMISPVEDQ